MADVNLGVVGVGGIGRGHAASLQEGRIRGAKLAAVCDTDRERLAAFPGVPAWTDAGKMYAEAGLDGVLIATPHVSHVPLGIAALDAGLHVLMEKPVGVHKADAERLIAAHRDPSLIVAMMFNQRTDPRYQWIRTAIEQGILGQINRVHWTITDWFRTEAYYRGDSWRATWAGEGGGILLNQAPHQLDLWQWLFGMPQRVRGFCAFGRYHDIEVEDDVTAHFTYEDGMTGVFTATTGEAPGTNRLEIAAENGRVVVEKKRITFERNSAPTRVFSASAKGVSDRPDIETSEIDFDDNGPQHAGIIENFADAVRGRAAPIAGGHEGIRSLELSNAILLSSLTDTTVELPLDGEVYARELDRLIRRSRYSAGHRREDHDYEFAYDKK